MMNTTTAISDMGNMAQLQARAHALRLSGLLARWDQVVCDSARLAWVTELLGWEETERDQRSLERRLRSAHIGKFKPLADFEWDWPTRCDRQAVQELMTLSFMADASNVMLVGPNGVGKSMLACNLGHQALIPPESDQSTDRISRPTQWRPAQASAVLEVLDEIREWIWLAYGSQIQQELRRDCAFTKAANLTNLRDEDVPA